MLIPRVTTYYFHVSNGLSFVFVEENPAALRKLQTWGGQTEWRNRRGKREPSSALPQIANRAE